MQTYLSDSINEELQIPPTRLVKVPPTTLAKPKPAVVRPGGGGLTTEVKRSARNQPQQQQPQVEGNVVETNEKSVPEQPESEPSAVSSHVA